MSRRLTCPACDGHAFAFRRTEDGDLAIRCLGCEDPPTRVLVPTLRLREPHPDPDGDPGLAGEGGPD